MKHAGQVALLAFAFFKERFEVIVESLEEIVKHSYRDRTAAP